MSQLSSTDGDADRWREAATLRREFRGWIVIWLASDHEFRAYRRLPGARRDTALHDRTIQDMAAQIEQAEQSAARRYPRHLTDPITATDLPQAADPPNP